MPVTQLEHLIYSSQQTLEICIFISISAAGDTGLVKVSQSRGEASTENHFLILSNHDAGQTEVRGWPW